MIRTPSGLGTRLSSFVRCAAAPLLALVLAVLLAPAAAAQPAPPNEQEIFAQLGVDSVPADYVVLVDTSGSMASDGLYDRVRSTLFAFLAGTSPADHVAIYGFDSSVVPRYVGPGGDPAGALARLPAAPSSGLTDIGGAISSALDELERSGAAQVGSVVLLTDGVNDPPSGSPYGDVNGRVWTELKDRAARLADPDRTIRGYSLPLRSDAEGARLLGQVLPETTVVDPAAVPDIAGFLDRTKRAIRVDKARQELAADVGRGVAVEWPAQSVIDMQSGRDTVAVTLRSQSATVPLTVSGITLRVADAPPDVAVLASITSPIELGPGAATTLDVQLSWAPGPGWLLYERTESLEPALTVEAAVASSWSEPLSDAGIELGVPAAPVDATRALRLEAVVGYWWVLPALAALLVALALLRLLAGYLRKNPQVRGRLYYRRVMTADTGSVRLRRGPVDFAVPARNGGPPGRGTVRPIRTASGHEALEIVYSPDGSDLRRTTGVLQLSSDRPLTISAIDFSLRDQNTAGSASGPAGPR